MYNPKSHLPYGQASASSLSSVTLDSESSGSLPLGGFDEVVNIKHLEGWWWCSVAKLCLTLQPHELQQAKLLCPSPSPGVCPSSCPIESVMPSNHLILCHFLLLPASIFPRIRVFSNESELCIRWPKDWSFSFSPSSEDSVLIFFRIDWFYLLAVQGILQSLLQHYIWRWMVQW